MKALYAATLSMMITGTEAVAANLGASAGGVGVMANFFIGFAVLVLLFQFLPGLILLLGILKGLFSRKNREVEDASRDTGR